MSKSYSRNYINFENEKTGIRTLLQVESYKNHDIVIKITPTNGYYVTSERLNWYKTKVKNYLNDPNLTEIIIKPLITESVLEGHNVNVVMSKFESYVLIPYACTEYQIATDRNFNNVVQSEVLHGLEEHNVFSIDVSYIAPNIDYYLRIRYGGGGYSSEWSDIITFTPLKATIKRPTVDSVSFIYQKQIPYGTTIVASSSMPEAGVSHMYSTWKIYKKDSEGNYVLIWSDPKSDSNLTNISITGQYPNGLEHNKTYYLTVTYFDGNRGFSEESEYHPFCSSGVSLTTPSDVTFFPWPVNSSNPLMSFDSFISITVDGQEQIINVSELEGVYWEIREANKETRAQKFTSQTNSIQLPFGTLKENTEYEVSVYYKHSYLGYSGINSFKIKTNKEFINHPDGLRTPIKLYNDTAYYGEVAKNSLMNENVVYKGVFDETKSYKRYEEVSKDGKLYICVTDTPKGKFDFNVHFETSRGNNAENIYGSQLPTAKWLLRNIGLYQSLTTTDIASGATDIVNEDTTWLKLQNKHKQTLYITKLPILANVSVNDLIRKDLFHPRRKTVRIGDYLYYVRILVNELDPGYDIIDPIYRDKDYNFRVSQQEKIRYDEGDLFSSLLNGNLAQFETTDLDIDLVSYRELIYNTDSIYGYKIDPSSNMRLLSKELQSADSRVISYRPVLELIPEENKPIYNISERIPGDNNIENYDPFVDSCYLGYVDINDFVDSEDIDLRTGLNSFASIQNKGWYKFYYRGLIYFLSNGTNFTTLTFNDINTNNLLTPTPLFATGVTSDDIKLGKIIYNNIIYNVMCPSVLTYTTCRELTKVGNKYYNIFNTSDSNVDLKISYDCFLSDVVYPILDQQYPNRSLVGYKGSFKDHTYVSTINQVGSGEDEDDTFLSSDVVCDLAVVSGQTQATYTPVLNYQKDPYRIKAGRVDDPVDVVLCLTVNPILDNIYLWKEKQN